MDCTIKVNKTLPYLVSNVIELLELEETAEEEGANVDLDAHKTQCAVIKTSTRATYFLPVIGLVDPTEMKPGDLVGVNKVREARRVERNVAASISGLVSCAREAAARVRLARQGDGGGRAANRAVQRYRRLRQANNRTHRGGGSADDASRALC